MLDENLRRLQNTLVFKRPFIPDVNVSTVGRRAKTRRVDPNNSESEDDSHLPLRIRYPSPTPGPSSWAQASMGTWGRGGRS